MKYSELETIIKRTTNCSFFRHGSKHPLWINPETGLLFPMSYHKSKEVKTGTLKNIILKSGAKIK